MIEQTPVEEEEEESDELPMKGQRFITKFSERMLNFEVAEIGELNLEKIYFAGQSLKKTDKELELMKGANEAEIMKDFDDEEGYYNVLLGDHLIYRYEILKILGKGSFA